ncbi:MAG: hypothetical protein WHV44_01820 [Anaerolineales bacterium]
MSGRKSDTQPIVRAASAALFQKPDPESVRLTITQRGLSKKWGEIPFRLYACQYPNMTAAMLGGRRLLSALPLCPGGKIEQIFRTICYNDGIEIHAKGHPMDRQHMTDLLLENESLTSNLPDLAARALLDWAAARLDALTPPDDEHFAALVQFLRAINRLAGALPDVSPEDLAALLSLHQSAFGASRAADESACARLAQSLANMTPEQAVSTLLDWAPPTAPRHARHAGEQHVA